MRGRTKKDQYYELTRSEKEDVGSAGKLKKSYLRKFKDHVSTKLDNTTFKQTLANLSDEDKILLIRDIISMDASAFESDLRRLHLNNDVSPTDATTRSKFLGNKLIRAFEHRKSHNSKVGSQDFLSSTAKKFITALLTDASLDSFSDEKKEEILSKVMQNIHDDTLSTYLKRNIVVSLMSDDYQYGRINYEYLEKPRFFSALAVMPYKKMTASVFRNCTKRGTDHSQLIVLASEFISSMPQNINPALQTAIDSVNANYLTLNYREALLKLMHVTLHPTTLFPGMDSSTERGLISTAVQASTRVDVDKNDVRRFFETRLSQYYLGSVTDVSALDRFSHHFTGKHFMSTDGAKIASCISELSEHRDPGAMTTHQYFKAHSRGFSQIRDKQTRPDFTHWTEEYKVEDNYGDSVYSSNFGVMRSISPMFFDDRAQKSMRNRFSDRLTHSHTPTNYPMINRESPFVTSLSGHTFLFAALLVHYAHDNQYSPTLEADVNTLITMYTATYVANGFHSKEEVLNVFKEQKVIDAFANYGVKVNISFNQRDVLEAAMKDTARYCASLKLKRNTQEDLKATVPVFNP